MSDESVDGGVAPPPASAPARPGPTRGRRFRGALVASAAAGLVVGSGAVALAWNLSGSDDDRPFTLVGQARAKGNPGATGSCVGSHELSDIDKGALVTVYDSAGRVVATGSLGSGAYDSSSRCVFPIAVRGVPGGSASYSVQVGWHGKHRITNEQARTGGLVVTLD
ncbi:hypothetical protein [Streptomyces sp. Tue6028]|uniref:hypothetical protein n=1 Tax=Streptomyces sp. Tue6028 TaxID=2036037 RepID=UPI0011814C50|nr:hypothetical protein [Streptomyces sp. Tue6028]